MAHLHLVPSDPDRGWKITTHRRPEIRRQHQRSTPTWRCSARAERDGLVVEVRSLTERHAETVLRERLRLPPPAPLRPAPSAPEAKVG